MKDLVQDRAKVSLLNFLVITSEAYNVKHTFTGYKRQVVDPIVRLFKKARIVRTHINDKIMKTLVKTKSDMELQTGKKTKKSKELKKLVGKIEQKQIDLMAWLIYQIFMQRHKLKVIYIRLNREDGPTGDEEEAEEVQQARLQIKIDLQGKARAQHQILDLYIEKLTGDAK
jgi:hypothetical protein